MSKGKLKSKASVIAIRMKLLWIWFLKNLTVFLKLAVLVCVILILFGVIKFGDDGIIDIIFGDVINSWTEARQNGFKTFESVLAALLSLGLSVFLVMKKTRSITIKDIKSRSLKVAMLKANLYFNENGKLCKKLEETTKMDLDGDGKVGDTDLNDIPDELTAIGVVRAAGELATILTAPIDPNYGEDQIVEEAELSDSITESDIEVNEKLYTEDSGAPTSDDTQEEDEEEYDPYDMDQALDRPSFIVRFFMNILRALRLSKAPKIKNEHHHHKHDHKKDKSEDDKKESKENETGKIEVVENDNNLSLFTEEASSDVKTEVIENEHHTEDTIVVNVVVEHKKTETTTKPANAKSKKIDDILSSM